MIRQHDFNSNWWGSPVAIIDSPKFFECKPDDQEEMLRNFAWAEYAGPLNAVSPKRLVDASFCQVDTQINFRLNLKTIEDTSSTAAFECRFADESIFDVDVNRLETFASERFFSLPGVNEEKVNHRYAMWASSLVEGHPECCLEIQAEGETQGWFLSAPDGKNSLSLTLAMKHRDATISGALLYRAALIAYADRGYRLGQASFSVKNIPVMNIYASLGARFTAPLGIWQRVLSCKTGPYDFSVCMDLQ
ncbi:hypothetical protein GCM10007053_18430 [Halioglobus pacificus]|uniref:Uncharacterized protein n=2 Tax=Parahalioglobus pacificus TaxID=930806 RepID=A0A919CLF2_9GAMM|nr:hypothetical protein GCM10007053_18430 [Halioglobus pacificus]